MISASERTYAVTGSKGDNYTVKFAVANGHRLAECDCPARGLCYHIAAAASVNIGIQSMRRQTAEPQPVATKCDKPATSRADLEAAIVKTWSAKFPHDHLADALMYRFKVNSLSFLADGWLQDILAAIA